MDGKKIGPDCLCRASPEVRGEMEAIAGSLTKILLQTQRYETFLDLINNSITANDNSFNIFLKLTVSSSLDVAEKVNRILENVKERNLKVVDYVASILDKCYKETCFCVIKGYLRSNEKSPDEVLLIFQNIVKVTETKGKMGTKAADIINNLKEKVKLFANLDKIF